MCDVESIDAVLARFGVRMFMMAVGTVIGPMAEVGMVEVKSTHLVVVVCRSMHVRGPGAKAERQVQSTATQCDEPTHPAEYIRAWNSRRPAAYRVRSGHR